jgi:hypothetical protein
VLWKIRHDGPISVMKSGFRMLTSKPKKE